MDRESVSRWRWWQLIPAAVLATFIFMPIVNGLGQWEPPEAFQAQWVGVAVLGLCALLALAVGVVVVRVVTYLISLLWLTPLGPAVEWVLARTPATLAFVAGLATVYFWLSFDMVCAMFTDDTDAALLATFLPDFQLIGSALLAIALAFLANGLDLPWRRLGKGGGVVATVFLIFSLTGVGGTLGWLIGGTAASTSGLLGFAPCEGWVPFG